MLEVVTRREWGAAEATKVEYIHSLTNVKYVFLVPTHRASCANTVECKRQVSNIQERHVKLMKVPDIKYNFLIGGDGLVYEGRGFNIVAAIPNPYYNLRNRSIMVAFMGEFHESPPSERMFHAFKGLIRTGIDRGYLAQKLLVFHL